MKDTPVRSENRTGVSDCSETNSLSEPQRAEPRLNILLQSAPVRSPHGFETFPLLHKNFRIGFDRLSLYRSFASNNSPAGISTQARSWGEGDGRSYFGNVCYIPHQEMSTNHTYAPGERVWVTGPRLGGSSKSLPILEPYTGQILYVDAEWFRPVRKFVYTSKRTITGPIIFQDYFDGVSIKTF